MRVIAGTLRGRRLATPRGRATRPTPARVREALFSMLEPVRDLQVLDLYAGSGALAIEALSRGAARAVLVERARPALVSLRQNLANLGLLDCTAVLAADASDVAGPVRRLGPYDLVLVDPPYADVPSGKLAAIIERLVGRGDLMTPTGRLALEHAARHPAPALATLALERTRSYGDTALALYER